MIRKLIICVIVTWLTGCGSSESSVETLRPEANCDASAYQLANLCVKKEDH